MMVQTPAPESFALKWRGDSLTVTLKLDSPRKGRAALRTNIGRAPVRRREIIEETEQGITPLAKAWTDIPMEEVEPGFFRTEIKLGEVGIFSGKACFFPEGSTVPEWPEGRNFHVKVESAETRAGNSIYCVFPRQFGSFREVVRRLPVVMDEMGFRIVQTLPPFPVPATYAVMGEYGCPFAATDFFSVDPAMAEFDERATPLDQFRELIGAVHARRGLLFVDLPANHTGWASALQTHHPEWFRRGANGRFVSPGAWGVTWADLVELDYRHAGLRAYMAEVFLFWCRNGVDGFRCDAGYMIPAETWEYVVARVREEYPDTVFLLEGLGGKLEVTDRLLAESNLDWAYSEIFQTYDRAQFEQYLPGAIARSERYGTLVHFAETHDNDRLAKQGETYARLRVQLAALLSWQGAWGIANGVEWFCREKIDVHGCNDLNWGAPVNMVELIGRLNRTLVRHPSFRGECRLELVTRGPGNVLAVLRRSPDAADASADCLVLANLDCANRAAVDWDRGRFAVSSAADLLSGRAIDLSRPVELAPGEVLAVSATAVAETDLEEDGDAAEPADGALFHIVMPRDAKRDVVVPAGELAEVAADCPFRVRLVDPESGRTLLVVRSRRNRAAISAPEYLGDGTACRRLRLLFTAYRGGRASQTESVFLVPPPPGQVKFKLNYARGDVLRHPGCRVVLANDAGACAQMRLGWGTVESQYDAMLAANPSRTVPSDRLVLWTRTRCWLQREGYAREIDCRCVTGFAADPAGRWAKWDFAVPCGMGMETAFTFTVALVENSNASRLEVRRRTLPGRDVGDQVRLVFRPDLEWRSFHAKTKAFSGPEGCFAAACRPHPTGVDFAPYGETFRLSVEGGEYHHEPQWTYCVAHPEEADRGQDGSGDLFSPGWISADLKPDGAVVLTGALGDASVARVPFVPDTAACASFAETLRRALELYVVRRDGLKTVIAGYPWFLDWGRDTFIAMRGMIAAGRTEDSLKILRAFAAFEECGTLPNIIYGKTAGNRDTTDAQLWFIRCVQELGEKDPPGPRIAAELRRTCESIVDHYVTGTPNGIRMDPASGLVWSPPHFTWMDTNYPACTPRVGYPVEIQALWICALKFLGRDELAERAKASLERLFKWEYGYRDCLAAPNGEPAEQAVPEDTIRPNQLFLVTLGVLSDRSILRATEELLVPGGIRTLNSGHPLYRGVYAGDEDTERKPAYHNGTVWAWPFPQYAEALAMTGACPRETALALLAGAVDNLNSGCVGHLSECADGDSPHRQKACCAQAWSDSELLRVWLKLGGK